MFKAQQLLHSTSALAFKYYKFFLQKVIIVFHIVFRAEGDYYSKQLQISDHCNWDAQCLVRGRYGRLLKNI
jgi:hypothetical protein